ncbi:hypothetical protein HT031_002570 [Scenedesmus sp. PABB004]|nr:hypothetical protein HT031_002570 [Scenedesmus sp. PABB004]
MLAAASRALRRRTLRPVPFMAALGVFCLSNAAILLLSNRLRALAPDVGSIPDLRQDLTAPDVEAALSAYGAAGRRLFALIEAIDLCVFMWSYAFVLSGMLSLGASAARLEVLKLVNLLPFAAAGADAAETGLMLAALWSYPRGAARLAPAIAAATRLKWRLLAATASAVGGVGCYCVATGLRRAGEPAAAARGGGGGGEAAPGGGGAAGGGRKQQQRQQRRRQR